MGLLKRYRGRRVRDRVSIVYLIPKFRIKSYLQTPKAKAFGCQFPNDPFDITKPHRGSAINEKLVPSSIDREGSNRLVEAVTRAEV